MTAPDSPLVAAFEASPNHGERRGGFRPSMLLLHYTGMTTGEAALERLKDPTSEVSCHYLVFEDGVILQMVPESRRAWHAGQSEWSGTTDINSQSIGIEIVNPGHAHGYRDFPPMQMEAVVALCRDLIARWAIVPWRVLAHSDVAPQRKMDPGERFDWRLLAKAGVGLWVEPAPICEGPVLQRGHSGAEVSVLQQQLGGYGYGVVRSGRYGQRTEAVVLAFQRHFRQAGVDGRADASTRATLQALLAARADLEAGCSDL